MNVLDVVLSTQVIAGILIVGALVMSVRSILMFTREASQMAPKLQKVETNLALRQEGMGEKRKLVKELTVVVDPLREREGKLRAYFESLKTMELDYDRQSSENSEKEEAETRKRIQRKKMGFD